MTRIAILLITLVLTAPVAIAQKKTAGFWDKVWKILGVTATSGSQKGPIEDLIPTRFGADTFAIFDGDLWIYRVPTKGNVELRVGNFRSPVFLPNEQKALLALSGERVVKIPLDDGPVTEIATVEGIQKLIEVPTDAPGQVLILMDADRDNCPSVAILSLTDGAVTFVPHEGREDDLKLLQYLRGWERTYADKARLEIKTKTKNGREYTDVILRVNDKETNVSKCEGVNCSQPALSSDRTAVVYVKAK